MNGDSNTVAIMIALAVLLLSLIGTLVVVRFVVRRIRSAFLSLLSWIGPRPSPARKDAPATRSAGNPKRTQSSVFPKAFADDRVAREVPSPDSPPSRPLRDIHGGMRPDSGRKAGGAKPERATGWIPREGNGRVGGRDIGGMVYVGRGPRKHRGGVPDNGFIDSRKNVSRHGGDYDGQGMGYWPDYSSISDRSRSTYLDWLSGGRSDTRYNVGYVFLYFYGLGKAGLCGRGGLAGTCRDRQRGAPAA